MKNIFNAAFVSTILLISVLVFGSCKPSVAGSDTPNSDPKSSNADRSTPTGEVFESTIGDRMTEVAECNEMFDMISELYINEPDGDIAKTKHRFFLNRLRDSVRKSFEGNKTDKKEMAKICSDYKKQIEEFKVEESNK